MIRLLIENLSLFAFSLIANKKETLASEDCLLFQCTPKTASRIESV